MQKTARAMMIFWGVVTLLAFIYITAMGFTHGFADWWTSYLLPGVALAMFLYRRWIYKRYKRSDTALGRDAQGTSSKKN